MNDQKTLKCFCKYVALNILGQIAYSCYTLADTFFVSASLGADGLTALNLAFPMFCLINGTGLLIGMGGGTRFSILKSRGEDGQVNAIFTNAIYLWALFSVIFVLLGYFLSDCLTRILGADETVFSLTHTYLRVMLLFNFIILRLPGNAGVAAFGVITVISLVVVAIYTGLSQGTQPFSAQTMEKEIWQW